MESKTKIEAAIYDVALRLNYCEEQLKLLSKERDVLRDVMISLEIIKKNEKYE